MLKALAARLSRFGKNLSKYSREDYIRDWYAGGDITGSVRRQVLGGDINESTALSVATVYACCLVIAETLATVDLNLLQKTAKRTRHAIDEPEYYLFRHQPNPNNTPADFIENALISALLQGNSYMWTPRNNRGRVIEAWNINPNQINAIERLDKELIYHWYPVVGETPLQQNQLQKIILGYDALHFKRFSRNGVTGISTMRNFSETMGLSLAQEEFQTNLYLNGVMNKGVLETSQTMDKEQMRALREQFNELYAGVRHSGSAIVLPFDLKFKPITMSPEDAQMILNFNFTERQIAKVYRVPLYKLQNHDKSTFNNVEHLAIEFVQDCIRPWAVRFEQMLNTQLLTEPQRLRGLEFKFDLDLLMRGATKERYDGHNVAIMAGFKTRNEVRAVEDLDPIDGLDEPLMPLNMVPVSQAQADSEAKIAQSKAIVANPEASLAQQGDSGGAGDAQSSEATATEDALQNDALPDKENKAAKSSKNSRALEGLCALYADGARRYAVKVGAAYSQGGSVMDAIVHQESYLKNQLNGVGVHLFADSAIEKDDVIEYVRNMAKIHLDQVAGGRVMASEFADTVSALVLSDVRGMVGLREDGE